MTTKPSWKPWHEVVQLRDDLKTGELSLAVFAADLYDVVMQKGAATGLRRPLPSSSRADPSHVQSPGTGQGRCPPSERPERQGLPEAGRQLRWREDPHVDRTPAPGQRPGRAARSTGCTRVQGAYWSRHSERACDLPCASTRSIWKRASRRRRRTDRSGCCATRGVCSLFNWQVPKGSGSSTRKAGRRNAIRHSRRTAHGGTAVETPGGGTFYARAS